MYLLKSPWVFGPTAISIIVLAILDVRLAATATLITAVVAVAWWAIGSGLDESQR